MRPPQKDAYGRPVNQRGYGAQNRPGQKQAYESPFAPKPAYGQTTEQPRKQQPPQQQLGNIKNDVVWALRNTGGGMSLHDIVSKCTTAGKPRYQETKVQNILEILLRDKKVEKSEETGRVTYKWAVESI